MFMVPDSCAGWWLDSVGVTFSALRVDMAAAQTIQITKTGLFDAAGEPVVPAMEPLREMITDALEIDIGDDVHESVEADGSFKLTFAYEGYAGPEKSLTFSPDRRSVTISAALSNLVGQIRNFVSAPDDTGAAGAPVGGGRRHRSRRSSQQRKTKSRRGRKQKSHRKTKSRRQRRQ